MRGGVRARMGPTPPLGGTAVLVPGSAPTAREGAGGGRAGAPAGGEGPWGMDTLPEDADEKAVDMEGGIVLGEAAEEGMAVGGLKRGTTGVGVRGPGGRVTAPRGSRGRQRRTKSENSNNPEGRGSAGGDNEAQRMGMR